MKHGARTNKSCYTANYLESCNDRFGHIFSGLACYPHYTLPLDAPVQAALEELGNAIGAQPANAESNIPAGFTYLGQFIDHDITLDIKSTFDKQLTVAEVKDLRNFRTPSLDLDSVYGRGPNVDFHMYVQNSGDPQTDGIKFLIGENRPIDPTQGQGGPDNGQVAADFDVPRNSDHTALIGDPRNNENLIISQLHHSFLKFHNAVVDFNRDAVPDNQLFAISRQMVIHHYQWIVLKEFLPTIAMGNVVQNAITGVYPFLLDKPFSMPVEFSAAAYRFGHSMIRPDYELNDSGFNPADMFDVFQFSQVNAPNGPNRLPVFSNWAIDFNRFFNTGSGQPVNMAMRIDTSLSPILNALPGRAAGIMQMLARRNLVRGVALRVPFAQAITKTLGITALDQAQLLQGASPAETAALQQADLLTKTPLWYYILKEAEVTQNGERLGELGSIIVALTFVRILQNNHTSILCNPGFTPSLPRIDGNPVGDFTISDLLNFAGVLD